MEQRDFKGVWFPKNIWLDNRLSALDKIILLEIDSLDCEEKGCFASNEYIANFCQCSERKVTEAISKLIELNYIYQESFNGRTRILRSNIAKNDNQTRKKCEAESQKTTTNNNIDYNSILLELNNLKEEYKKLKLLYNKENTKESESKPLDEVESMFEEFWKAYPRKDSKKTAFIKFKNIKKLKEEFENIMKALEIFKNSEQWKNPQYIPMPSTWLNQERWKDESIIKNNSNDDKLKGYKFNMI